MNEPKTREQMFQDRKRTLPVKWFDLVTVPKGTEPADQRESFTAIVPECPTKN